jgi:heptosyltransferase-2
MGLKGRNRQFLSEIQLRLCLQIPTLLACLLCGTFRLRRRPDAVRAILVIRLDGMGDCVLTLPLLQRLRLCFPSAVLTVVTRCSTEAVFRACPAVDEVLTFEPLAAASRAKLLSTLWSAGTLYLTSLRGRYFDIAMSPRWDVDVCMATFLCALTRAPVRVGYEDETSPDKLRINRGFQRIFTTVLPAGPLRHEVERNLELAAAIGCSGPPCAPRMAVPETDRADALAWLPNRDRGVRIALGLPAGSPKRRWTLALYLLVLEELRLSGPVVPIVFADAATASMGRELIERYGSGKIALSLSLSQAASVLSECDVFLGSDSGLGHVAAAAGCPTATLSPHPRNGDPNHTNSPIRFKPFSNLAAVYQPRSGRTGCERACEAGEPHCILDIDPHEVALGVRQLAESGRG